MNINVPSEACSGILNCINAQMHAPDWIQAGLLLAATAALIYNARALKEQTHGRDVENYFSIYEKFAAAWRRFGLASVDDQYVEFTELMNLFESACDLYLRGLLRGATRDMLGDYMRNILPNIASDEDALRMVVRSRTTNLTYGHIVDFARAEGLNSVVEALTKPPQHKPETL